MYTLLLTSTRYVKISYKERRLLSYMMYRTWQLYVPHNRLGKHFFFPEN